MLPICFFFLPSSKSKIKKIWFDPLVSFDISLRGWSMVLTILNTLKIIHFLLSNIYSCLERSLIFHKKIPYIYIYIYRSIDLSIEEHWKKNRGSARRSQLVTRQVKTGLLPHACIGSRYGSINVTMHPSHKYTHRHTGYS